MARLVRRCNWAVPVQRAVKSGSSPRHKRGGEKYEDSIVQLRVQVYIYVYLIPFPPLLPILFARAR